MITLLVIMFYVLPSIFMLDAVHAIYKYTMDSDTETDVYVYQVLLVMLLSICPIINIMAVVKYFDILWDEFEDCHDELWEAFKKYSIFKFLLIKLK